MANLKREDTAVILKKLDDCRLQLQRGNVYSCLIKFKEAWEKTLRTKMLNQDEREVHQRVSDIEHQSSTSGKAGGLNHVNRSKRIDTWATGRWLFFKHTQLVQANIFLLLLPDVLTDGYFIRANR